MEVKFNLSNSEYKDLVSYCNLNNLLITDILKKSYLTGFNIERYGLLNSESSPTEKIIEKEIIKYVEVPKIEEKEVIKIEYVEVEKIIEVPIEKIIEKEIIREIPKEIVIEKENDLKPKFDALQKTVQKLKQENIDKDKKIQEYEKTIHEIQAFQSEKKAVFLNGSNLDDKLYNTGL